MLRLTLRHTAIGLIFWLMSLIFCAASIAIISLLTQLFIPFNATASLIVGGLLAIPICFMFRRFIYAKPYHLESELTAPKGKDFWLDRLGSAPITVPKAYCTLLPMLIFVALPILPIVLFYPQLSDSKDVASYIYLSATCSALGSAIISPVIYAILTAKSFVVCSGCKAVNSLIFDEELSHSSAHGSASYGGVTYGGVRTNGIRNFGGSFDPKMLSRDAERSLCHCKYCGAKNVSSRLYSKLNLFR